MRLPRSFSEIHKLVNTYNGRVPRIVWSGDPPSPEKMMQGTRASAAQGTMSSDLDPLVPGGRMVRNRAVGWDDPLETPPYAIFDVSDPQYQAYPGTVVQIDHWPPNRSRPVYSPSPGRESQSSLGLTNAMLNEGPPPGRIMRWLPERVFGVASQSTGAQGGEGFPWNADMGFIPHIKVARQALGTKGPQKLSDDNAAIPAIYAGNPRP